MPERTAAQERASQTGGTRGEADASLRRPLGIEALDRLLCGGLPEGNSLLVQGAPGTGKTILGMQFLQAGLCRFDEPGLLVTFEEHPSRLYRDAHALGWDFGGYERARKLLIVFTSPAAFLSELAAGGYGDLVRGYGFRRVVVDCMTKFEGYPDPHESARVRSERVVNGLRREGLSVLMTRETDTREPPFPVTPQEYLADTIVQLEYRRQEEARDLRRIRLLEVLKNRGSAHSSSPHPFVIAEGGLRLHADPAPDL